MSLSKFSGFYFLIGCLDLVVLTVYPSLRWVSKPLILISLIVLYLTYSRDSRTINKVFLIGLVAALLGDLFLLKDGQSFFLYGLGSFLIMQILYIITFLRDGIALSTMKASVGFVYVLILGGFISFIKDDLGDMTIPVMIYSCIIAIMAICALLRRKNTDSYMMIAVGAIFFMISDGFIAYNSFIEPLRYGGLIVMSTYILAQYMIVIGWINYEKSLE